MAKHLIKQYQPNPQGKGSLAVLSDLLQTTPVCVKQKKPQQWLADYFTSLLVLGSAFKFKPIVGQDYYLYYSKDSWKLSLIEPREWSNERFGTYFGKCSLHEDRSWSVEPVDNWEHNEAIREHIENLQYEFVSSLNTDQAIIETLPFFQMNLPYYQRLSANALARSLKMSLEIGSGDTKTLGLSGRQLLSEALQSDKPLLSSRS